MTVRGIWPVFLLSICACAQAPAPAPDPRYAALVERLLAAPDESARQALLDANGELANSKLATALMDAAAPAFNKRDYEKALPIYRVCAGVSRSVSDRLTEAKCSYNVGLSLVYLYRIDEALPEYDRARAAFDEIGEPKFALMALSSAGVAMQAGGQFRGALPHLERALKDAETLQDRSWLGLSHMNLGSLCVELGRYREALLHYENALDAFRDMAGAERRVASLLNNMGDVYHKQKEFDLALSHHQQSIAMREKIKAPPEEFLSSYINIAADLEELDRPREALPVLDRALQLSNDPAYQRQRARSLHNYGYALKMLKRGAEAAERFEEAAKLARQISLLGLEAESLTELAKLADEEGRSAEALELLRPVIEYSRDQASPEMLAAAQEAAANALMKLGRWEEAEAAIAEAIRAGEEMRAEMPAERQALARFQGSRASSYRMMVEIQIARKQPELALAWAERSKARVLLDVLHSGGEPVTKSLSEEERKQEAASLDEIRRVREDMLALARQSNPGPGRMAALQRKMEEARVRHRSLELALYAKHPELKFQRAEFEPASPGDLVSALPDAETALLEYEFTGSGACLFVITKSASGAETRVYRLPVRKENLVRDVKQFRELIAGRNLAFRRLAGSLYRDLLAPAQQQLRGKRNLVIVPDGELWQLPFQALETGAGRYLIEEYGVLYAPSLTVLRELRKQRPAGGISLLAVDAAVLTGVRREVDGLREVYGPANVRIYTGAQADTESVAREAPKHRILHLAAHGVFDDRHPMDSYLVLAKNGKAEAGTLLARQMMGLNLNADMVVLSGCETGRGSFDTGEGLIGMSWALFIGGARATVASQWKVDAESTAALMSEFHRGIRRGSKVKAMRQAVLQIMQQAEFRHPFYWSGFVLMGGGY